MEPITIEEDKARSKLMNLDVVKSTDSFVDKILETGHQFDTGWMPMGIRSFRENGRNSQAVVVSPPGINRINMRDYRYSHSKNTQYLVAQPWRVFIIDMIDRKLHGARAFYSPEPITSMKQPLYHQNLPNINCLGYTGGVAVGWVCLYHTGVEGDYSIGHTIATIVERCSGGEGYNLNMQYIDGFSLYKKHRKPGFLYQVDEWEKKTEKEGFAWTMNPDMWIPVRVRSADSQREHMNNGKELTIEMAMNGLYDSYYHQNSQVSRKKLLEEKQPSVDVIKSAFQSAKSVSKVRASKKKKTA